MRLKKKVILLSALLFLSGCVSELGSSPVAVLGTEQFDCSNISWRFDGDDNLRYSEGGDTSNPYYLPALENAGAYLRPGESEPGWSHYRPGELGNGWKAIIEISCYRGDQVGENVNYIYCSDKEIQTAIRHFPQVISDDGLIEKDAYTETLEFVPFFILEYDPANHGNEHPKVIESYCKGFK